MIYFFAGVGHILQKYSLVTGGPRHTTGFQSVSELFSRSRGWFIIIGWSGTTVPKLMTVACSQIWVGAHSGRL